MKQVKVSVFLDQKIHAGGGYQQALNMAVNFKKISSDICHVVFVTCIKENIETLSSLGIDALFISIPKWKQLLLKVRRSIVYPPLLRLFRKTFGNNSFESFFIKNDIDLVFFTSPSELALDLESLNYFFTVWDLCHNDDPEFPEVRENRQFELREKLYERALPKAAAVFPDSEIGKENILRRFRVDADRVHVLPFSPGIEIKKHQESDVEGSGHTDVKSKYGLDCDYIFYPAQFWAHKNHVYLLQGLKILEQEYGKKVGAILSGGDAGGNLTYVKQVVKELGLSDRVVFAGFVSNEEIPQLYKQSLALVMPTYFGPTNIPPLEAFSLDVPVLYPDKHGLRDQVMGAALLMDLTEPSDMSRQLAELIDNPSIRDELVSNGKKLLASNSDELLLETLSTALQSFVVRRQCWS